MQLYGLLIGFLLCIHGQPVLKRALFLRAWSPCAEKALLCTYMGTLCLKWIFAKKGTSCKHGHPVLQRALFLRSWSSCAENKTYVHTMLTRAKKGRLCAHTWLPCAQNESVLKKAPLCTNGPSVLQRALFYAYGPPVLKKTSVLKKGTCSHT
jgi:hypothetical protein